MSNAATIQTLEHPQPVTPPTPRHERRWIAPLVIGALVVGLAGLGVGAYAVATTPAKTSGPQGPVGQTGPVGPQGQQGVPGAAGPAGAPGTLAATTVVNGAAVESSPDPAVGTVLVAKTSCPAGKILLSGGARVSAPGVQADRHVEMRASFPLSATQWETVSISTGSLGAGVVMTMRPYVACGEATPAASSTTPTT
jgi:hypothetical protein